MLDNVLTTAAMFQAEAQKEEHLLQIETLQAHLADFNERYASRRAETELLQAQIAAREEKLEEVGKDQERLEDELYSKTGVLERLRKQLDECERALVDAERRYADQSSTLDKERQYYNDAESLLRNQKSNIQAQSDKLSKQNAQLLRDNEKLTNQLGRLRSLQKASGAAAEADGADDDEDSSAQNGVMTPSRLHDDAKEDHSAADAANLAALGGAGGKGATGKRTLQDENELLQLRSELESTSKSHASLQETMQRLQIEMKELKNANKELREQNETFQGVLEERTLSGSLLKNSALLRGAGALATASDVSSTNDGSEEDEEADDAATDDTSLSIDDVDDVDDLPSTPKSTSAIAQAKKARRRSAAVRIGRDGRQQISTDAGNVRTLPSDLGSELEKATEEHDADADEDGEGNAEVRRQRRLEKLRKKRSAILSNDPKGERNHYRDRDVPKLTSTVDLDRTELQEQVVLLREESKSLRDANKGLTLYVSKILDRIIAREGYEHILAIDSEKQRTMRGAPGTQGRRNGAKRASVLPINKSPEQDHTGPGAEKTKRQSMRLLGYPSPATSSPGGAADRTATPADARQASKRTASVDWRSLLPSAVGGGSSSSSPSVGSNGNFRPLALQSSMSSRQNSAAGSASGQARKLQPHEEMEDDNDVAERERIRATLQLEGIVTPAHQLQQQLPAGGPPPKSPLGPGAQAFTAGAQAGSRASSGAWGLLSRVISTSSNASSPQPSPLMEQGALPPTSASSAQGQAQGAGFLGPRLTTFDDPTPARPQSDSLGKRDQALSAQGSGLTELPPRASSASARFQATRRSPALGVAADASFVSRQGSVAGDESYILRESEDNNAAGASAIAAEDDEPGWKRALKRVSLLTSSTAASA